MLLGKRHVINPILTRAGFLVILLFSAIPSCSKKEEGFETRMVDGIKIVRNLAPKPEKAYRSLGFTEDISIGEDEEAGDSLFVAPVDIDSDADGNIYVLDARDAVIRLFGSQGSFIRTIGRKGQGPGEFERPICMDVLPNGNILVVDQSLMRLTTFAENGRFAKSSPLKEYIYDISLAKDGVLIAGYSEPQSSTDCVGTYDIETGLMTPLFSQATYWPARSMNKELTYDFPYFVRYVLDSERRLYTGSGVAYEITAMGLDGRVEFKFSKDQARVPVQGEMLDRISNLTPKGPNPYVRDPYFPFFESLAIDERGRVWVQHYLPKISKHTYLETPYDVFSADGVFLFETRIPGHMTAKLVFKNGYIYALKKVESGYLKAVRFKVKE